MLLIPLCIISYIIFSLHLPSGVTSFAIQTPSNSQQQPKIWIPPSQQQQQQQQKRGNNIFSITNPEDLLDFIIEDDRLCVVKVYASWCTTCKKFDLRYRKIASQYGDKQQHENNQIRGQVRFASLQYDKEENREMCNVLKATSFPYIIMYKGSKGKIREFQCTPAKINLLVDAIKEELADDESDSDDGLSQQVIELGLAGNR